MKSRILYGSGSLAASVLAELTRDASSLFSVTRIIPSETDAVEESIGFLVDELSVLEAPWETWGTGPSEKRKVETLFRDHLLRSVALRAPEVAHLESKQLRNVEIVSIDAARKTARLESGEEIAYDELYWAGSPERLRKLANVHVPVASEGDGYVGLAIHLLAEKKPDAPRFEARRIFSGFKYRSEPYAAVGVGFERVGGKVDVRLVLPLLMEDAQDREALAKLATALRREASRRLEEQDIVITEHQFQFLPTLFTGLSRKVRSPELAPGLFFVGPELVCDDSLISAPALAVCRDNTLRALESSLVPDSTC